MVYFWLVFGLGCLSLALIGTVIVSFVLYSIIYVLALLFWYIMVNQSDKQFETQNNTCNKTQYQRWYAYGIQNFISNYYDFWYGEVFGRARHPSIKGNINEEGKTGNEKCTPYLIPELRNHKFVEPFEKTHGDIVSPPNKQNNQKRT